MKRFILRLRTPFQVSGVFLGIAGFWFLSEVFGWFGPGGLSFGPAGLFILGLAVFGFLGGVIATALWIGLASLFFTWEQIKASFLLDALGVPISTKKRTAGLDEKKTRSID